MIYFIQRKDGSIFIGEGENVDRVVRELEPEYGKLEVLGFMPGSKKEHEALWQRFGVYKNPAGDEWLGGYPELIDFIDENATVEISEIRASAKYKASEYTPIKQQSLSNALFQQINLVVHITQNWARVKPYLYFDLNAGPGIDANNQPGSPVIFRRIANQYQQDWEKFRFEAHLYEADTVTHQNLSNVIGDDPRFSLYNSTNESLRELLLSRRSKISDKDRKWVYGTVYADPSNATLPWEMLELMNDVYPHVDIMINIACTSYKRTIARAGYETLAERLPRIKKQWLVRKPFGKHQWSILIGTNWPDYPAWKEKDFFQWNDNDIGTAIFEKLVYTPEQIQKKRQLPLWGDDQ